MPNTISKAIKNFLFPDRDSDHRPRAETLAEGLATAHELILNLAVQIEFHADHAPYPHVAQQLRRIASEKRESANRVKGIAETLGARARSAIATPKSGKNHWERLNLDLRDQVLLDDLLITLETKTGERPEISTVLKELKVSEKSHRQTLSDLIAVADPQATQT